MTETPVRESSRRDALAQDDAPPPARTRRFGRTGVIAFLLSAVAVAGVGLLVMQLLSGTPQSTLESVGAVAGKNQQAAASASPATTAASAPSAAPTKVPTAPKSLGTVKGVYRLRGPATAVPGSWALFVLSGAKRVLRSDVSAPFSVPVNTRTLPNGDYTLTVVVMRAGAPARVATRVLKVDNAKKAAKTPASPKPSAGTGTGSPAGGSTTGAGSSTAAEVVTLTNAERAKNGCPALAVNSALTTAAQAHSTDMANNNYFSHDSQDGRSPFDRMKAAGYDYRMAAENIAMGQQTAQDVVTAWMNSAGHRANILNCGLTEIGVGYALNGSGTPYWTQDFGTPA